MNIVNILYWDVDRTFCDKVGIVYKYGVDSGFGARFGSGGGEEV